MQATHTLSVERRERTGSRYSSRARAAGKLPCVLYGQGKPPAHLLLDHKEAVRFFQSGERVFNISLASESKTQTVLLKDLQFGYLGDDIVHADLMRVNLDDEIEANVSIELFGDAKGLKGAGGAILTQQLKDLTVKCTVATLPEQIRADVTDVTADEPLLAGQITLPAGLTLVTDRDTPVAVITIVREEAEGEAAETGAEAQPAVVKKEKKDEGKS